MTQHLVSVHPGKIEVQHERVRRMPIDFVQRLNAILRFNDGIPFALEQVFEHGAQGIFVLHE